MPDPAPLAFGEPAGLRCSSRGCRSSASWVLRWNNPKIHDPRRRKTWLACEAHVEQLSSFLSVRGMLRDRCDVAELPAPGALASDPAEGDHV